jgi:AraC-like DNA-binding protein
VTVRYEELVPPAPLRPLVHRLWTLRGDAGVESDFQRAMPDGRPEIIFNLADRFESRSAGGTERQPAALLVGPTTSALELRPTGRVDLVGLRLQPGAGPALVGLSGLELLNRAADLSDLRLSWTETLAERLAGLERTVDRVALVQSRVGRMAGQVRRDMRMEAGIELVLRSRDAVRIRRIADLVGLSPRHLARLFRERVGVGPKLLGRLTRFQRVLRALEQGSPPRWAAMAQRHGYFDQAHLGREFRGFAGVSPGRYLAAAREVTRHFIDGEAAAQKS